MQSLVNILLVRTISITDCSFLLSYNFFLLRGINAKLNNCSQNTTSVNVDGILTISF